VLVIERIWRKVADRLLSMPPDDDDPNGQRRPITFSHIGKVGWVPVEYNTWRRKDTLIASGGLAMSWQQQAFGYATSTMWELPGGWPGYRRWPDMLEMLPTFRAPRGGIRFIMPRG
jgi:hypothetical protein